MYMNMSPALVADLNKFHGSSDILTGPQTSLEAYYQAMMKFWSIFGVHTDTSIIRIMLT